MAGTLPRIVVFLDTGMALAPNQQIFVGETETFPEGKEDGLKVLPINIGGDILYILEACANEISPLWRMKSIPPPVAP